jgi:hypothetical protein
LGRAGAGAGRNRRQSYPIGVRAHLPKRVTTEGELPEPAGTAIVRGGQASPEEIVVPMVDSRVILIMRQIADEQGFQLPELHADLPLHETGLDSLAFTVLLSRLEDDFGFDPFSCFKEMSFPSTVGELAKAYDDRNMTGKAAAGSATA